MTSYLRKSFSVLPGASSAYRDNFERTFGRRVPTPPVTPPPNLTPAQEALAESTLNCLDCSAPLDPGNLEAHRCPEMGGEQ